MDEVKLLILSELEKLPIVNTPVNKWEGTKYRPYMKRLVDLDKLIELINKLDT